MLIPFKTILAKYNIQPKGILHIGASTGQEAIDYHNAGIKDVVWIEAIPFVFQSLIKNIEKYPYNIAFNECIGDEDGEEVKFNISSHGAQSSSIFEFGTHKKAHPEVRFINSFKAVTKRVDTLFKEHELEFENYDFLNIDLQGAELMALKGIDLTKVNYAYLEVNKAELYVGCPLIEEIDTYMWLFGFERVETEWCGNTNWGDSLYIKK